MDREERVRKRAYEIWDSEGRPEGRQDQHWARALGEIVEEDLAAERVTGGDAVQDASQQPTAKRRKAETEPAGAPAEPKPAPARRPRRTEVWSPADVKPAPKPRKTKS